MQANEESNWYRNEETPLPDGYRLPLWMKERDKKKVQGLSQCRPLIGYVNPNEIGASFFCFNDYTSNYTAFDGLYTNVNGVSIRLDVVYDLFCNLHSTIPHDIMQ